LETFVESTFGRNQARNLGGWRQRCSSHGIPDLVWQNPATGGVQIWFMSGSNGAATLGTAQVTASNSWYVVAAADFNKDGVPDPVWQQLSGATKQHWYMTVQ
jgi:hypothetical protein